MSLDICVGIDGIANSRDRQLINGGYRSVGDIPRSEKNLIRVIMTLFITYTKSRKVFEISLHALVGQNIFFTKTIFI